MTQSQRVLSEHSSPTSAEERANAENSNPVVFTRAARRQEKSRQGVAMPWVLAGILGAWALLLRLWNLGKIHELIFDEIYYVREGYTLLREGVEHEWAKEGSKEAFESGDINSYLDTAQYVVHPPVGKWVIAGGQWALGADNPWGWRISVALLGTLAVVLLFFVVRRLLGNLTLAFIAGFLLSIDGVHLTHSRTGLLDLILGFFCLLAFYFLLVDRDKFREALGRAASGQVPGHSFGNVMGIRWWRIAAGMSLGLACGVKWSGLYFVAVFGILTVLWDWWARKQAGDPRWALRGFVVDAIPAFFAIVGSALVVYVFSWAGWFASANGYFRTWAAENGYANSNPVSQALISLWHYHTEAYKFHVGLTSEHTYQANPYLWLFQWRPTSFYYRSYTYGQMGCSVEKCSSAITNLGNPIIWWLGCIALLITLAVGILRRDGRSWTILSGIAAGYLPWLAYSHRTIFQFYTVAFEPWLIMAIVFMFGLMLGGHSASKSRRFFSGITITSVLVLITLVSAFFWPIWTGEVIPYEQWRSHMWLDSWI